MKNQRPDLFILFLVILIVTAVMGISWLNNQYTTRFSAGEAFVSGWAAGRTWLEEGGRLYSEQAAQLAQQEYYGGAAPSWKDQLLFSHPSYAILIYRPFVGVEDFRFAQAYWMTLMEVCLLGIAAMGMMMTRWSPPRWLAGGFIGFVLLNYYSLTGLQRGELALVSAALICLSLLLIQQGQYTIAGIAMALAAVKPEMVILTALFILVWTYSHRKLGYLRGFFGGLLGLFLWSNIQMSGWWVEYLIQMKAVIDFKRVFWVWDLFEIWWGPAGRRAGLIVAVVLGILLLREWALSWKKDERWFLWTAGLTLVCTSFMTWFPQSANFTMLLPVMVMVFSIWQQRWGEGSQWLVGGVLGLLGFGLWGLHYWLAKPQMIEPISLFLIFPLFLLFSLYWVRYWAIGSRRLPIQQLESLRNL